VQTHGGAPAAAAIEQRGGKRYPLWQVLVDWARDGEYDHPLSDMSAYVDQAFVDRSLAGSSPQEVMLIEGHAAAEFGATCTGRYDGLSLSAVFSPYNGFSPFYGDELVGCGVIFRIGIETAIGAIWYDQFFGEVRNISPGRSSNEVVIKALDRVEALRVPVTFPKWAISSYHVDRGWSLAQVCESQWVIDHCLRHGDTSPSPYRWMYDREKGLFDWGENPSDIGAQFFLTGNGGHTPAIGQMDNSKSQGYPKSEGAGKPMYSLSGEIHPDAPLPHSRPVAFNGVENDATGETSDGPYSANENRYWARNRKDFITEGSYFFGLTLDFVDDPDSESNHNYVYGAPEFVPLEIYPGWMHSLKIAINTGSVRAEVRQRQSGAGAVTPWYAIPVGPAHVQIDVVCDFYPTVKFGVFINGVLQSVDYVDTGWDAWDHWSDLSPFPGDYVKGLVVVRRKAAISDAYWHMRSTSAAVTDPFIKDQMRKEARYPAVLDRGLNRLTNIPQGKYEDAWQVITAVASAELGSAFWDEYGTFRFWNRETITAKQEDVVRTLTLSDIAGGLDMTSSLDGLRNIVTSDARWTQAALAVVYSTQAIDELYVPGVSTVELTIYRDDIQQVTAFKVPRFATVPDANVPNLWVAQADTDGYVVQWLVAGVWAERNHFTSGVDLTCRLDANGNLVISAFNGYAEPARFATGTGDNSAALRVMGTLITSNPNVITAALDQPSIEKYGERNMAISGDWVQWQPAVTSSLVSYLLPRTLRPVPTTDQITIAGDPRLQIGDTLEARDPEGLGETLRIQIFGYRRTVGRTAGLVDQLSVELVRPTYIGLWDSLQYGRWDETFVWSA